MSRAAIALACAVVAAACAACSFRPNGAVGDDGGADDAAAADAPADHDGAADAAIDAAGSDARPPCPASYDVIPLAGGSRYRLVLVAATFGVAAADCNDDLFLRTHLATFENGDLDAIMTLANPGNQAQVLVGATCVVPAVCNRRTSWAWIGGGGSIADALWGNMQPAAFDDDVAESSRTQGTWTLDSVSSLTATRPYLCECDP